MPMAAAAVHAFTALGIVCALCATRATIAGQFEQAFFWLGVAFVIDGVDGVFARRYRVAEVMPTLSGETLDLVIDYVTYVFVPALMILQAGVFSGPIGLLLASLMCMSSLYHFADEGSKAKDHAFVGFPAIWNVVVFYLFALAPPAWASAALIIACVVLTFVPLKWVHPIRVRGLRVVTLAMTTVWGLAALWTIWSGFPAGGLAWLALAIVAIYGLGLVAFAGFDDRDAPRPVR
jgi:phosphatidylcholine synthase